MFADSLADKKMTVYGYTSDEWGGSSFTLKGVLQCEYESGGTMQRDANGNEFMPASTFYPVAPTFEIVRGDRVILGDTSASATPPNGAEEVMKVGISGAGAFGWPDEVVVYTG